MAESAEHNFLKTQFIKSLECFSKTGIYGYNESDRKKLDMSCYLTSDWRRLLVGQTCWANKKELDKNVRELISISDSDIWALIIKDSIQCRNLIPEIIEDFRRIDHKIPIHKLKIFWIPSDFDADKETDRIFIEQYLRRQILDDILFGVVFGNLTAKDVHVFLDSIKDVSGLEFRILSHIKENGFSGYPRLSADLNASIPTIRERVLQYRAIDLLTKDWRLSLKCEILLKVVKSYLTAYEIDRPFDNCYSPELLFILDKLDLNPFFDLTPEFKIYVTPLNIRRWLESLKEAQKGEEVANIL